MLEDKLAQMQEEGKDEHDIKAMQNQIAETSETLATCKPRIESANDDLEQVVATYEELPDGEAKTLLYATEEWIHAEVIIVEAKAFVEAIEL